MPAVQSVIEEALRQQESNVRDVSNDDLVHNAKKIARLVIGLAHQTYGAELEKQQQIVMNISDILMETYAMESTLLRTMKLTGNADNADDMCSVFLRDAITRIEMSARSILGECAEGEDQGKYMTALRGFAQYRPIHALQLRRRIARRLLDEERYVI